MPFDSQGLSTDVCVPITKLPEIILDTIEDIKEVGFECKLTSGSSFSLI